MRDRRQARGFRPYEDYGYGEDVIMNPKRTIPRFKTETEERKFWAKHDSTDFVDYSRGEKVLFPNPKPSIKAISIRLPEILEGARS